MVNSLRLTVHSYTSIKAEAATNQQGDFYDKKYFYTTRPANWLLLPLLDACM